MTPDELPGETTSQRSNCKLRERYLEVARTSRSSLHALVDVLFRNPYVTVVRAQKQLGLTGQGARNIIKGAEKRGWLVPAGSWGQGGRLYWVAADIFDIIEAPLQYSADGRVRA